MKLIDFEGAGIGPAAPASAFAVCECDRAELFIKGVQRKATERQRYTRGCQQCRTHRTSMRQAAPSFSWCVRCSCDALICERPFLIWTCTQLGGVATWENDHGEELSRCATPAELTQWCVFASTKQLGSPVCIECLECFVGSMVAILGAVPSSL